MDEITTCRGKDTNNSSKPSPKCHYQSRDRNYRGRNPVKGQEPFRNHRNHKAESHENHSADGQ